MNAVDVDHSGTASGINNAISRVAGLLAIAILGIVMASAFNTNLDSHLAAIPLSAEAREQLDAQRARLSGAELPTGISEDARNNLSRAIDESFVAGYRTVMLIASG
jgi:hypothetical protein